MMNLSYSFKRIPISGFTVQEPIIKATLIGHNGKKLNTTAVLDTGSDFVLLSLEVAELLELEYKREDSEEAKMYTGKPITTTKSRVTIAVEKGREKVSFSCICAISLNAQAQHENIIFGSSFLQNFRVELDYPANRFYLKNAKPAKQSYSRQLK